MSLCNLNRNILRSDSCGYSLPQLTDLYVANYDDVKSTALSADTSGCEEVTAITMNTDKVWYHVVPAKDSISYTDALVVADGGSKYRTHTITFNLSNKYDACMHGVLDTLSLGRFMVVAKSAEGSYLMFGRLTPLEASETQIAGGSDTNGMTITLTANVTESAVPLNDAAINVVIGG